MQILKTEENSDGTTRQNASELSGDTQKKRRRHEVGL
jgi:hypothetical protein